MTAARMSAIVLAALVCGAGVVALLLGSDHQDAKTAWAIFGPAVGWSFIGVGLYAWRRRPESRTGVLMVLLGFAWFLSALNFSDSPLVYSLAFVLGGLWGGVFLQLIMGFPSGRLGPGRDRALVIAGYLIFTVASIPAMLFAAPHDLGCDDCPSNVLLIHHDSDLAHVAIGLQVVLYLVLFVMVLVRLIVALAAHQSARAPPAHAGLRVRAAHLPARDGGHGGRGRRRGLGRVQRHRAAAVRLPGRVVAQPRGTPGRRPARPRRRAARLARAPGGGR